MQTAATLGAPGHVSGRNTFILRGSQGPHLHLSGPL